MKKLRFFKRKTSGNVARERLKQLLLNDRMNVSADLAEKIHRDLIRSVSKYLEIDEKKVSVVFEKCEKSQEATITAVIPVVSMKKQK